MKRNIFPIAIALSIAAIAACAAFAGGPGPGQSAGKGAMDQSQVVNGKIAYMERLGGYYIRGEDPPGEMMIVNQDAATLAELQKTGKTVKVQGRFTIGADHFFIEKIDGKPYGGK